MRCQAGGRAGLAFPIAEQGLDFLHHMIPIELACDAKQDVVRFIALSPEVLQVLPLQRMHALVGSELQPAQWSALIKIRAYQIEDTAHRLVVAAANLLQDQVAHLLQLVAGKRRREEQFVKEFKGWVKLAVHDLCPDHCGLQARAGAFAGSQGLKCLVEGASIFLFCALEEHVFKEVSKPLLPLWFVDNGCVQLKSEANRAQARHILTNELNALW